MNIQSIPRLAAFLIPAMLSILLVNCSPAEEDVKIPAAREPYLTVLGVAQDAGYPQAGCTKACCARVHAGDHPGAMVSCLALVDPVQGRAWLFDATPDLPEQLHILQADHGSRLEGVFLTHAHIGHYTGLMYLGREAMGASRVPVYAMPRMAGFLQTNGPWSLLDSLDNIDIRPLTADSSLQLGAQLSVTPILVPHRDEFSETVGFIIRYGHTSALYLPDIDKWQKWEREIEALLHEVDLAFLDGTFFAEGEVPGRDMSEVPHPFVEESLQRFGGLPDSVKAGIHFIHFNHTNPLYIPGSAAQQRVRSAGLHIAYEGQVE